MSNTKGRAMNSQDAAAHEIQLKFMAAHCNRHSPKSYLEIGTRDGDSLRAVLKSSPLLTRVVCADTWGPAYGGTSRGGSDHIVRMVSDHGGVSLRCLDGDSKVTIPTITGEQFDLVLVDGDHSSLGASADLANVLPLVSPGGFVLFHDISHPAHRYLSTVFDEWCSANSDTICSSHKCLEGYGFGVAQVFG